MTAYSLKTGYMGWERGMTRKKDPLPGLNWLARVFIWCGSHYIDKPEVLMYRYIRVCWSRDVPKMWNFLLPKLVKACILTIFQLSLGCSTLMVTMLVFHWFTGYRGALPSQWEAVYFRYEDHLSVGHQATEGQPGGGTQPCGVCGYEGHQVHFTVSVLSLKSIILKMKQHYFSSSTYNTDCQPISDLHSLCHVTP